MNEETIRVGAQMLDIPESQIRENQELFIEAMGLGFRHIREIFQICLKAKQNKEEQ